MAIDRTGISSLDAGASDITYSGNEGPKSPQEEQQMQMASLMQEYKDYVMQQEEAGRPAMPFEEWVRSIQSPMAEGGIARLGYIHGGITHPDGRRGFPGGSGRPNYSPMQSSNQETGRERAIRAASTPGKTVHTIDAPEGAHEYIGGQKVYIGDVEGKRIAEEKADFIPEEKTIPQKAKDIFLGPTSWALNQVTKRTTPYYIKHALEKYKKKMGYDHPMLYEEEEGDDFIKQALIDMDLAKEGNLSTKDFEERYMSKWQLAQRYPERYPSTGGEGQARDLLKYPYPQDMHPGTGGITDATGAQVSDWNVASLDQPFDRSTPTHDFSGIYADGGRVPAAYGGMMGDDGRRAYGLGSFFKSIGKGVKGAFKTVKKVAKSPAGKMAIAAALMGAPFGGGPGATWFGKGSGFGALKSGIGSMFTGGAGGGGDGMWSTMLGSMQKNPLPWIAGASAAGGLYTKMTEDDDEDEGYQKWLAEKNKWLGQIGDFPTTPVDPLYQRDLMAADGGRIGYDDGGLSSLDFVDKIYSDEARALAGNIPEIRKGSQYAPTLFEERTDAGEWKYPGEPREGQEYLTSTLQGANTILDKMEMKKQRLKELAREKGLDFDDIFKMELDRIYDIEGQATKKITKIKDRERILDDMEFKLTENLYAQGGRIGYKKGGNDEEEGHRSAALSAMYGLRKNAQEGGLMDLGGMEKDYRQDGGFVPIGGQERADDVPARLSKNEFVFTADAVRAAGGGDIDAGAEVMENVMENLEQGGNISEESQGLEGARDMFATAQRLEGVM